MPNYEYEASDPARSCPACLRGFERFQSLDAPRLTACPDCGAPIRKRLPIPAIGRSQTSLDQRAKNAGFRKLKKISKGEYEKQY
jgi:putative FmdB family regulatory protein